MVIGGKRQRSALTVSSNHVETSQQSTPGTVPRVSDETPLSSPPLAKSSVASTTPAKRGREKSRGVTFAKVRANGNCFMKSNDVFLMISRLWMLLHSQEHSRINTNNRAKLKVQHTGGSKPFVWHRKKLKKMMEIQSQSTTESGAPKDVDIFTQVLGTRSSYVRGLGRSVKPIAASSSTLSIQRDLELVRELEAAKATIEELKARQSEYDILKNQQAEMQEAQRQIQEQL
ncbi:hypothetical protein CJ030_MR6G005973 [Morella rubra]|uniref:Uncharacterized protein n=1 Tax=Morella rubra TaxID=262757 RepID=A0A6A1VAA9_9ROSI|nr:hypothetical protein CJ030_MR6G005973 [Morella rubra]